MPEQMKAFRRQQIALTITREGNSFTEKAKVGNVDFEKQQRINEEIEVKEKKENPVFHVKVE